MTVSVWLAVALWAAVVNPVEAAEPATIPMPSAFNPPVNQDLLLSIVDERQLADGLSATFRQSQRLRFTPDAVDGWQVRIDQVDVACTGPDAVCAAFVQILRQRSAQPRLFRVNRLGVISAIDSQDLPLDSPDPGLPGANAALVVAHVEGRNPGQLESGELREALQFIRFNPAANDADLVAMERIAGGENGRTAIHQRRAVDTGDGTSQMMLGQRSVVDAASGLMVESRTETLLIGNDSRPVSIGLRQWSLTPVATP